MFVLACGPWQTGGAATLCPSLPAASSGRSFWQAAQGTRRRLAKRRYRLVYLLFPMRKLLTNKHRNAQTCASSALRTWRPSNDWGLFPPPKPPGGEARTSKAQVKLPSSIPVTGALLITCPRDILDLQHAKSSNRKTTVTKKNTGYFFLQRENSGELLLSKSFRSLAPENLSA